ncbi:putative DNA recombinase [Vibrio phage 249E41-1]|nr:putative DNA recombinase [Vibrio phage 249E41-1]
MTDTKTTGRNVAYKRVSTTHQEFHRQLANVNVEFVAEFSDKLSGGDTNRPQLKACLTFLQDGDTLYCHEISRLARNVEDLRHIVFGLMERGVSVKFVKEGLEFVPETGDDFMKGMISKMLLTLLGSVAEFEKALINNRIVEGVQAAIKRGVKFGGANPKQRESFERNKQLGLHKKTKEYSAARENRVLIAKAISSFVKTVQSVNCDEKGIKLVDIATHLNNNKFKTPRGGMFAANSVGRLVEEFKINRVNGHMVVNV